MPRDSWSKANARSKYGPAPYAQSFCKNKRIFDNGAARKRSKASRKAQERMSRNPAEVARRFSPNSVLWFGKHKNKPICEVPMDYLAWLASEEFIDYRKKALAIFLQGYASECPNDSLTRINSELNGLASM
jgi:hypothetical protein